MTHSWELAAYKQLASDAKKFAEGHHLRELLKDQKRNAQLCVDVSDTPLGFVLDGSRQLLSTELYNDGLKKLYSEAKVAESLEAMRNGEKINATENRAVLHWALRAGRDEKYEVEGKNVVPEVYAVRERVDRFVSAVHGGELRGVTGEKLTTVLAIGIGGSYLGVEFVYEALRLEREGCGSPLAAGGRKLVFLSNVDPTDLARALAQCELDRTLVIVISKTFTTAETMINAGSVRERFLETLAKAGASAKDVVAKHFCAVSTNLPATSAFGIEPANVFGFWDWVGGRFSVTSAVGYLPLSLVFGSKVMDQFLRGANAMDRHAFETRSDVDRNPAALMALLSYYNSEFLGVEGVAVLPYAQALLKFPAHIQQLTMESNGKAVAVDGTKLHGASGEVFFGEPGTNGQHSFYQLLHQGRVVATEFIGYTKSQTPYHLHNSALSNHDELMCNFFAQPDALALGKTADECAKDNVPPHLVPHKTFPGNRPSMSLLFLQAPNAFNLGVLLSLYENRTAISGFLRGINSFDQWGVELGKVLAKDVRTSIALDLGAASNEQEAKRPNLIEPTKALMSKYMQGRN